ncbi:hypothetical protein [Ralstonia pseudosolanacearum]|uniref:hypothetical protein n=1 Tax=Ralstonia pseudosolanacearum TaxID=1310165 RepID=UPI00397D8F74
MKSMGVKTSANNRRCGKGRYREVDKSSLAQLAGLNCVAEGKRKGSSQETVERFGVIA